MAKSCKEIAQSLVDCMKKSECMKRENSQLKQCVEAPECQELRNAYFLCRRGSYDMRNRIKGEKVYWLSKGLLLHFIGIRIFDVDNNRNSECVSQPTLSNSLLIETRVIAMALSMKFQECVNLYKSTYISLFRFVWYLKVFGMSYLNSAKTSIRKFWDSLRFTKCWEMWDVWSRHICSCIGGEWRLVHTFLVDVLCSEYTTFAAAIPFSRKAVSMPVFLVPKGGFIKMVSWSNDRLRDWMSMLTRSTFMISRLRKLEEHVSRASESTSYPVTEHDPIADAPMDKTPGPQPKSPTEQSMMSSNVFAAVNIILLAISGDVGICSRSTGVKRNSINCVFVKSMGILLSQTFGVFEHGYFWQQRFQML